ncbi:hypothetical protein [Streptomyces anulatus]|uniref:hypothetical protein n=1 Tax=Streptomyces anulatus TaxID=1892 RepID=UPI00367D92E4
MACACKNKRPQFQVVQNGRVVYSGIASTAKSVQRRYPGSELREVPASAGKPAKPTT